MKHPIKPFVGACCLLGALVLGGCAAGSGAGSGSGGAGGGGVQSAERPGEAPPSQVKGPESASSRSFNDGINAGELLAMLQALMALPSQDLRDAEKVIALSRLPFREQPEHRDLRGIPRFFSITTIGENVETGTYWARIPLDPKRTSVYFTFSMNANRFCLTRTDIEKSFGNVWLSGFLNDQMPDVVPQSRKANEPNYGWMGYVIDSQRLLSFMFHREGRCVANISFQEGRDL